MCILLVFLTYEYHEARFREREVYRMLSLAEPICGRCASIRREWMFILSTCRNKQAHCLDTLPYLAIHRLDTKFPRIKLYCTKRYSYVVHLKHNSKLQPRRCKVSRFIYSYSRSTCFRRFLRPSSGARNCTYSFRYCQTKLLLDVIVNKMELTFRLIQDSS